MCGICRVDLCCLKQYSSKNSVKDIDNNVFRVQNDLWNITVVGCSWYKVCDGDQSVLLSYGSCFCR